MCLNIYFTSSIITSLFSLFILVLILPLDTHNHTSKFVCCLSVLIVMYLYSNVLTIKIDVNTSERGSFHCGTLLNNNCPAIKFNADQNGFETVFQKLPMNYFFFEKYNHGLI